MNLNKIFAIALVAATAACATTPAQVSPPAEATPAQQAVPPPPANCNKATIIAAYMNGTLRTWNKRVEELMLEGKWEEAEAAAKSYCFNQCTLKGAALMATMTALGSLDRCLMGKISRRYGINEKWQHFCAEGDTPAPAPSIGGCREEEGPPVTETPDTAPNH